MKTIFTFQQPQILHNTVYESVGAIMSMIIMAQTYKQFSYKQ